MPPKVKTEKKVPSHSKKLNPTSCMIRNQKSNKSKKGPQSAGKAWTEADWDEFLKWAKVRSLPKRQYEPEPIIRASMPLYKLKKGIKTLSEPSKRYPEKCANRTVSRTALTARCSKNLEKLAEPNYRCPMANCRRPNVIKRAALKYVATEHTLKLSLPNCRKIDDCGPTFTFKCLPNYRVTRETCALAQPKKYKEINCTVKRKKGKPRKMSDWMDYLAIPSYRVLQCQTSDKARQMKQRLLDEYLPRREQAYQEKMEKQKKLSKDPKGEEPKVEGKMDEKAKEQPTKKAEDKSKKKPPTDAENEHEDDEVTAEEDAEKEKRRKLGLWRFEHPCPECLPFPTVVSKSAMRYEASSTIDAMATPKQYHEIPCKDPWKVEESALNAATTELDDRLSKPKDPMPPVERYPPKRETDEYGRFIFEKPPYGKVFPDVPPYESKPCPKRSKKGSKQLGEDEIKKEVADEKDTKDKVKRFIDPIVDEPTIDPLFDPYGAKRQERERKRAAKLRALESNGDTKEEALGEKKIKVEPE